MLYGIYRKLYLKRLVKRGLTLGNNFQLEKGANIDAVFPKLITIGNNVTLAKDVYVLAHDGSTKKLLNYTKCSKTTLEDNVFVGTRSVIMPGVTVGKNSIIGACSLVNKDVPAGEIWGGVPAKRICSIDEFLKKYQDKFNTSPHLDLNGKRTFELDDSVTDKFIATLVDNIGFIE